ncbi:hypothetical protein BOX15_Mlig012812g2 [Macrostomum lignano]|uniref:CR-type domain-containing protein n=1 Tax=Macrostomum lignano TaxID=282301 RepID=A0A267GH22_9PLAT|nr:hypothetical protein BOX15_Mlig012812g2 [Macrostomum lignano]
MLSDDSSIADNVPQDRLERQDSRRSASMPWLRERGEQGQSRDQIVVEVENDDNKQLPMHRLSVQDVGSKHYLTSKMSPRIARRSTADPGLCAPSPMLSRSSTALDSYSATQTEVRCREALKAWAASKFGCRIGCAQQMEIRSIRIKKAYQYSLETFVETRDINEAQEPSWGFGSLRKYSRRLRNRGGGGRGGDVTSKWEVDCPRPARMFEEGRGRVEVPGSAKLVACPGCEGVGFAGCPDCRGAGLCDCVRCEGTGYKLSREPLAERIKHSPCYYCATDGTTRCPFCEGTGRRRCSDCKGHRTLRRYLLVNVRFNNVSSSQIVCDRTDLLEERLSRVTGHLILETEELQGRPLADFPQLAVQQMSERMLEEHRCQVQASGARVIRQRQRVYLVPVTEVGFSWRGRTAQFWLYGVEQLCFCPNYPDRWWPASCCWLAA